MRNSTTNQRICPAVSFQAPTLGKRARALGVHALSDESGQIFPLMALLLMFFFLGLAALSLDIGHAIYVQKQLQASADSAALAAARHLADVNGDYATYAQNYSDAGKNTFAGGVTFNTPIVNGLCLGSIELAPFHSMCGTGSYPAYNAVQVTETATLHTFFAGILGRNTMQVSVTSTAALESAGWNIALILDTTPSMDEPDSSCGLSQLDCARQGMSNLLAGLDPNTASVALFTFPGIDVNTIPADTTCGAGAPAAEPYVFPKNTGKDYNYQNSNSYNYTDPISGNPVSGYATYEIVPFTSDFQSANGAMQTAIGNGQCAGMQTSQEFTYIAGAIYAAQSALLAQQANNPGSRNAIILLSDGDATARETETVSTNNPCSWFQGYKPNGAPNPNCLDGHFDAQGNPIPYQDDFLTTSSQVGGGTNYGTSSGTYPSYVGQCGQEVIAAQYAAQFPGDSTRVYTVAYGSLNISAPMDLPYNQNAGGDCPSDIGAATYSNITPCQAMQQMSSGYVSTSNDPYFYSDGMGTAGCDAMPGNSSITDLASIFNAITSSLRYSRLIPNNTAN